MPFAKAPDGELRAGDWDGSRGHHVRTRLAIRMHALMERFFPERRLFLRSDSDTRFIRLRPGTQAIAFSGATLVVGWTIIATAVLLMDSIGSGSYREQAKREQITYQQRLNALSSERDSRAAEAVAAQERFNTALQQISTMQSELLESEARRRELETGIDVIQTTLRDTMKAREEISDRLAALQGEVQDGSIAVAAAGGDEDGTMNILADALAKTAAERDQVVADAQEALVRAAEMQAEITALVLSDPRIKGMHQLRMQRPGRAEAL